MLAFDEFGEILGLHVVTALSYQATTKFYSRFTSRYETKAMDLLSGDHEGTLMVPCPPNKVANTRGAPSGDSEENQRS